jgi:hypothetical protein
MQEFLTPKWNVVMGTVFNVIDGITYLLLTIYFGFIDKHYRYIVTVGLLYSVICIVGVIIFVPESPLWLIKSGNQSEANKVVDRICSVNGIQNN